MKSKSTKSLVLEMSFLLIPLILYGIFKNGYLVYEKGLISFYAVFKVFYLILIALGIKFIFDLIFKHKIIIDYDLLYVILIAMIMPYNINLIVYTITFLITYIITTLLEKKFTFNKVCLIYLVIILINSLFTKFTFLNILDERFSYNFSFFDLFMGRVVGGIASTSIFFTLLAYLYLIYNFYYKKDIPLFINLAYLSLAFIYYLITKNNELLLNSEVIFASVFICPLPKYSPYKPGRAILYGLFIGILTFLLTFIDKYIAIYLATFSISLLLNIKLQNKKNV